MENILLTDDILLRRFELKHYDEKTNIISHEAFAPTEDDRNNDCKLSANCLRILNKIMDVNPFIFTLAGRSEEVFSVLKISINAISAIDIEDVALNAIHDPINGNESHCLICGYPKDAQPKVRKNVRRELAKVSQRFSGC